MKFIVLFVGIVLAAGSILAGADVVHDDVGIVSSSASDVVKPVSTEKNNFMEGGFQFSSINDGSAFATVGIVHEWTNGFALGVRGLLPMSFTRQAQAYMGQVVARFILLNEGDQIFLEPTITQGYYNGENYGGLFATVGGSVGYTHNVKKLWSLGALLGAEYSPWRISQERMSERSTLYNKVAFIGSYYF